LKESEHLLSIEDKVAPVSEIFRLQNAAELLEAEERYLPRGAEGTSAVVLAASRGEELGELTEDQPKTMVKVQGVPILSHIVDAYNAVGIKDILVVRGYKKEAVNLPNLTYIDNLEFAETGELASLSQALQSRRGRFQPTIVSYGDVLFNKYISSTATGEIRAVMPAWAVLPNAPFRIRGKPSMPKSISSNWGRPFPKSRSMESGWGFLSSLPARPARSMISCWTCLPIRRIEGPAFRNCCRHF